jgi:hypothetical protein
VVQAYQTWDSAAREGHAVALCDVGWMFGQGKGVPEDKNMAFKYTLVYYFEYYFITVIITRLFYYEINTCLPYFVFL